MTHEEFIQHFYRHITNIMDETGISPSPCVALGKDGTLMFHALDLPPESVLHHFWELVTVKEAQMVLFGLDRTTREGQGTEFADVLTCVFWWNDPEVKWNKSFKIGVVNYQFEPRIVRPIDWQNEFWTKQLTAELYGCVPKFRISTNVNSPEELFGDLGSAEEIWGKLCGE